MKDQKPSLATTDVGSMRFLMLPDYQALTKTTYLKSSMAYLQLADNQWGSENGQKNIHLSSRDGEGLEDIDGNESCGGLVQGTVPRQRDDGNCLTTLDTPGVAKRRRSLTSSDRVGSFPSAGLQPLTAPAGTTEDTKGRSRRRVSEIETIFAKNETFLVGIERAFEYLC